MAVEHLKFRCYACNQLLAVPPAKAGSIVACPKCRADLLIPGAEPPRGAPPRDFDPLGLGRETPPPPPSQEPILGDFAEIAAILPAELANLRPEDVRVESEFFETLNRPREPEPPVQTPAEPPFDLAAINDQLEKRGGAPEPAQAAESAPKTPAPVPPITIEPPSILPNDAKPRTVREVVIPAPAVLAWSLFGLVGIFVSFVAGLMVGHFMWKHS